MNLLSLLGTAATLALAALAAFWLDQGTERRGLLPPGFVVPWRRGLAAGIVATLFWLGVFLPLLSLGSASEIDVSQLDPAGLFLMHELMVLVILAWFALGWFPQLDPKQLAAQLGLRTVRPLEDTVVGLLGGVVGWGAALLSAELAAAVVTALFGQEVLPEPPTELVTWLVGLPVIIRVLASISAGVVEEIFFRGFLQPRMGVGFSTFLFVVAHAGYDQPLMLVALTVLSLFYAYLVIRRQSVWPAIIAHTLFDLVQLLVIIPLSVAQLPAS